MVSRKAEISNHHKNILISSASITLKIIYTPKQNLIGIFFESWFLLNNKIMLLANIFICISPNAPVFDTFSK